MTGYLIFTPGEPVVNVIWLQNTTLIMTVYLLTSTLDWTFQTIKVARGQRDTNDIQTKKKPDDICNSSTTASKHKRSSYSESQYSNWCQSSAMHMKIHLMPTFYMANRPQCT